MFDEGHSLCSKKDIPCVEDDETPIFGRTDLREGVSEAKFDAEADFDVRKMPSSSKKSVLALFRNIYKLPNHRENMVENIVENVCLNPLRRTPQAPITAGNPEHNVSQPEHNFPQPLGTEMQQKIRQRR